MIRAEGLSFCYENASHDALDNITFHIDRGEFVAILGHNGSGKSTFAKLVNALLLPTKGKLFIKGLLTTDQSKLWDIRQTVGVIFQNPDNQLVATVVEEDVAFGPENLGLSPSEIRERVSYALSVVGMEEYRTSSPHFLSGGQKQKIAIAGILAMKPECIVLDEPTAMLDPRARGDIISTIKCLNKDYNMTILYITHFMEEAVEADRIIVLNKGSIEFTGTPKEVFSQVKRLKKLHLDVPHITELASYLKSSGFKIPPNTLTVEEMLTHLCPSR
ncbi:MAG: energy-coupling factor transporter ATPase [Candidatus Eremiobacterota bacterium]